MWQGDPLTTKQRAERLFAVQILCPRCSADVRAADIVKLPQAGSWYHSAGEARCPECRAKFRIQAVSDDDSDTDE